MQYSWKNCTRLTGITKPAKRFAVFLPVKSVGVVGDGSPLRVGSFFACCRNDRLYDSSLGAPALRSSGALALIVLLTRFQVCRAWLTMSPVSRLQPLSGNDSTSGNARHLQIEILPVTHCLQWVFSFWVWLFQAPSSTAKQTFLWIFHGIVFFNVDDQRQYHAVIFKVFMVLDFVNSLLSKEKNT